MQDNKHCGRFDGKVLIPTKAHSLGYIRHETLHSQLDKRAKRGYLRLPTDSSITRKTNIRIKIGLPADRVIFARINNRSIMDWDGTRIQVRFHSGRTDSSGGHNDYKNISGLGAYHYHSGLPPHSYESSVKNKISSGLNKFIEDIKAEFDYYISQATDPERRESLIIGIVAGIVQNILKSGLDITEVLVVIADLASSCLLTDNTPRIVAFFDDAESWLSEPIDNLSYTVSYKDSYYLGKSLGDILSAFIGLFGVATGITTFISSFGLGTGSVLATPGTGGASLAGIAVSAKGALAGTAIASGSLTLAGTAFSTFSKDFNGFTKSKDAVKAKADKIRNVENDILDKMEEAGGHTLEKHVSQTNEELIRRAIQEEEKIDAATSFTDKSAAIKAVQENLRKNADDIASWLLDTNGKGVKTFSISHNYSVGKGVLAGTKHVMYDLVDSCVFLAKDETLELGFKIVTSYPIIK